MAPKAQIDQIARIQELEQQLAEAEETLQALRCGEVDAIVAIGPDGERVYTLKGADEPYRLLVQQMGEGAVTMRRDGLILFSNEQFAHMVGVTLDKVMGARFQEFVAIEDFATVCGLLAARQFPRAEIRLTNGGEPRPVQLSLTHAALEDVDGICAVITDLTERKRNEELVASEALARSVLERAAEAMVVVGPDGLILHSNGAAGNLTGNSGLMLPFDAVFNLRRRSTRYNFRKIIAALERGDLLKGIEVSVTAADGSVRAALLSASGLKSSDTHVIACVISLTDITERKRAENALRASEADAHRRLSEIEAIYESAPAGLALLDNNRRFIRVNRRFAAMNGWPVEAHIGKLRGDLNPDYRGAAEEGLRRILASGEPLLDFEVRSAIAGQPGVERILNENWMPFRNEKGVIVGISIATEEITAKRKAEEALRASEAAERARAAELQAILEITPAITFILRDAECREMTGNRLTYNLLGLPQGCNLSRSALERPRLGNVQFFRCGREILPGEFPVEQAAATGLAVLNQELELVFPDGRICSLLGNAVPLLGDEGTPHGAIGVFLDITDRKRTAQRLLETQKLESIGLLAGGVAHDFNNLLTGILGHASLAQQLVKEDGLVARSLKCVIDSSQRAAALTRKLLDYAGKGRYINVPVNLSKVVSEVSGLLRSSLPQLVTVQLDLQPDLPCLEADLGQVQQLVIDLMLNAAEAIGDHPGIISVRTGFCPKSEPAVFLEVRDTGCGMDEATKALIFDPFFTTKFMGRGLGLAAVAGIVRGHKGSIQVESERGKGSSFVVQFPVA
jgi:PAS domain S-box-containing protein